MNVSHHFFPFMQPLLSFVRKRNSWAVVLHRLLPKSASRSILFFGRRSSHSLQRIGLPLLRIGKTSRRAAHRPLICSGGGRVLFSNLGGPKSGIHGRFTSRQVKSN